MMYFDPRPKNKREDLFDREEEFKELTKDFPLILLLAPRRYGKTSLLKVFLNDIVKYHIFIDCRQFSSESSSKSEFMNKLENEINKLIIKNKRVLDFIKKIKRVNIAGLEVSFTGSKNFSSIIDILDRLNEWAYSENETITIAFDEAQNLRFFRRRGGINFSELFAYTYDNLENIKLILTGSEVGILVDFLDIDNPNSPLFGRSIHQVTLKKFSKEKSIEFLKEGFKQVNMDISQYQLEKIIENLDGIVGWLVLFGNKAVSLGKIDDETLNIVKEEAIMLVNKELDELFKTSQRYRYILKSIAIGQKRWRSIKESVEILERKPITDATFSRLLKRLTNMGYISVNYGKEITYTIEDPILKAAVLK